MSLLVLTLVAGLACGPQENGAPVNAERSAPSVGSAPDLPPVSVLVSHRVADFAAWEKVFDAHAPARKQATCIGHYLKRGIDEPERVYVYCLATDIDRLRDFLGSDDLAQTMRRAGVEGTPEITVMQPMSRDLVAGRLLPGIIVIHDVADYDAWRPVYDGFDAFRRESGIIGHAVSRSLDDPRRVIVYHQAETEADLRSFAASPELERRMQQAGVVGEPDIRFIRVVGFDHY